MKKKFLSYVKACLVVVACTAIAKLMHEHFDQSNLIMVYLAGVVWCAALYGRGPSVLASILSVASFDFFYVPPYLSFSVVDSQYLVTFAVMLVIAILISTLTARVQQQVEIAHDKERLTAAMYAIAQELSAARQESSIFRVAIRHLREVSACPVEIFKCDRSGFFLRATINDSDNGSNVDPDWLLEAAKENDHQLFIKDRKLCLRLNSSRGLLGMAVLHVEKDGPFLSDEQWKLLRALSAQIALAIENNLSAQEAELEKVRSNLLSSISHDLRTPLATITGAASSLLASKNIAGLNAENELASAIYEEANRLEGYVSNILHMTRLEAGALELAKEVQPIEEVIGAALNRLEDRLVNRTIITEIPSALPLVPLDAVLIEQVLVNLLDNALKYSDKADELKIRATSDETSVTVEIADDGCGIPNGQEAKIFEKFYRGDPTRQISGAGLGLAICHGIIHAHGGSIWAEPREPKGSSFKFSLPTRAAI